MSNFFFKNITHRQPAPPPQTQAYTDAAYREAVARQQAQYDAYARTHQQQQQFFRPPTADASRQAQQDQQFFQDFATRSMGARGGPEMFHKFGRDSDDEDDMMGSSQNRMDVDSAGPAFPQPTYTTAPGPPPMFPTPQPPSQARQQPSLRTQHEAATRIQRFWRNFLSQRTWRRNTSLHQLSLLRRKFDGLVSGFNPPLALAYAPTPDAAEIHVSTAPVPYSSFTRLSSDALSSMERSAGRAPVLAFSSEMRPIHATSEQFVRVLSKLDAVNSWGDPAVREARKALAGAVEGEASRMEAWIKVVWFSRNGVAPPSMPKPETSTQMPSMPEPTRMPKPAMQSEQQAWEQELQDRERKQRGQSYQPPPQHQPQPSTQDQEHPSIRELSDLRARFARLTSDFAVPEILEYTLQPARSMSNGLELIARLPTTFLSYHSYSHTSDSTTSTKLKSYAGPPLAYSSSNKPVHAYSESLVQMLGSLDAVESGGDARVRDARKGLAGDVEGEAARLESWWKALWVGRGGEAEVVKVRT